MIHFLYTIENFEHFPQKPAKCAFESLSNKHRMNESSSATILRIASFIVNCKILSKKWAGPSGVRVHCPIAIPHRWSTEQSQKHNAGSDLRSQVNLLRVNPFWFCGSEDFAHVQKGSVSRKNREIGASDAEYFFQIVYKAPTDWSALLPCLFLYWIILFFERVGYECEAWEIMRDLHAVITNGNLFFFIVE